MKLIDRLLSKIGLVRKTTHDSTVRAHEIFTEKLGAAAKAAGVPVLLKRQSLKNEWLAQDVFIVGEYTLFHGNTVHGGTVIVGPTAHHSTISNNFFTEVQP